MNLPPPELFGPSSLDTAPQWSPSSACPLPPPPFQLPACMHLWEQQMMTHVLESLPPTWEAWIEFLWPSFFLSRLVCFRCLEGEPAHGRFLCFCADAIPCMLESSVVPVNHLFANWGGVGAVVPCLRCPTLHQLIGDYLVFPLWDPARDRIQ